MPPAVGGVIAEFSFAEEAGEAVVVVVVVTMAWLRLAVMVEKLLALMTVETGETAIEALGPMVLKTGMAPT